MINIYFACIRGGIEKIFDKIFASIKTLCL